MFIRRDEKIQRHGRDLPHWQQQRAMQFVTFRLGDAMPKTKLSQWQQEREDWLAWNPKPWNDRQKAEHERLFYAKLEQWLDEGAGSCLFRDCGNRKILSEVLMNAQGNKVIHHSWVIMPNHVHLLFEPLIEMEQLLKIWKGVSARRMGRGSIWQANYRDTLIRDSEHFEKVVRYIRNNPKHLTAGEYTLWEDELASSVKEQGHSCP